MRSNASAAVLLLAGCGGPAALPPPPPSAAVAATESPRATAGEGAPTLYDEVGYASWYGEELEGELTASGKRFAPAAITAAHRSLPLGSVAEVTALDTGRVALVAIEDRGPGRADRLIDLSRGAAALLGIDRPLAPVRVRAVAAGPGDRAALAAGRPAGSRLDAPPALVAALRRRLPVDAKATTATPARAATTPRASAGRPIASAAPSRFFVQVAAFSNGSRAAALAKRLGGEVATAGALHRVRLGAFTTAAEAQRARDAVARQGYGDAQIVRLDPISITERP